MKKLILLLIFSILLISILNSASASKVFYNSFNDEDEIISAGGFIQGTYNFIPDAVEDNAIELFSQGFEESFVQFPVGENIYEDKGTIEFWVYPEFNIRDIPRFSSLGLMSVGNFPDTDTFGIWAYRSEYGPVIVFEIKDSEGRYKQAWSTITSFKPNKWHQIAVTWKCNTKDPKNSWARVYIDGKKNRKHWNICRKIDFYNSESIQVGTTLYHSTKTKMMDKLEIFDHIKGPEEIKNDYERDKPK